MQLNSGKDGAPVLKSLRQATGNLHRRLETRFDAVVQLADPARRPLTVRRYISFYSSAYTALAAFLERVEGLDFARRRSAWRFPAVPSAWAEPSPAFPIPRDLPEALGCYYIVEGSTLGGKSILREVRARGVSDPGLSFLDPYGAASGPMWRSLLAILEREGSRGSACLQGLCRGATLGFGHAERILCGDHS